MGFFVVVDHLIFIVVFSIIEIGVTLINMNLINSKA